MTEFGDFQREALCSRRTRGEEESRKRHRDDGEEQTGGAASRKGGEKGFDFNGFVSETSGVCVSC